MIDPAGVFSRAIDALNKKADRLPLAEVDEALKAVPDDYRLWQVKGLIHRELDQRELAIPALRRASELAPDDPLIAHGYARTLLEAGLPSVEPFARAMKLAPGDAGVVRGLAAALVAENRVEDAIAGVETVLRRSPLWVEGHKLLAELRWASGDRDSFTRSFDEALRTRPDSLDLRAGQLAVLDNAELFDEVLDRAEQYRRVIGRHSILSTFEAIARSETGDIEAADSLYAEIEPIDDANTAIHFIRHLLRTGRANEAIPVIDQWLDSPHRQIFWPLAATAWRLTDDRRSEWLEGDDRFVGVYDIAAQLPPLDRLADVLHDMHKLRSQMLAQSVRGGTQTDGNLFHRIEPEIIAVREALRLTVAKHVAGLPTLDSDHPLARPTPRISFSGAWSVRLLEGGRHTNHVHPMGWLSSALYVALPSSLGGDERAGWLTIGEPDVRLGLGLPPRKMIEPRPGRLALFPSWMWHGTRPFGRGERLTIAFDVA